MPHRALFVRPPELDTLYSWWSADDQGARDVHVAAGVGAVYVVGVGDDGDGVEVDGGGCGVDGVW